jgi:transcriptional regulator with XRE-family HTH domain
MTQDGVVASSRAVEAMDEVDGFAIDRATVTAIENQVWSTLRAARLERGWRQRDLAVPLGMSPDGFCRMETGVRHPSLGKLIEAFALMGLRLSDVLRAAEDDSYPLGETPWPDTARMRRPAIALIGPIFESSINEDSSNSDTSSPSDLSRCDDQERERRDPLGEHLADHFASGRRIGELARATSMSGTEVRQLLERAGIKEESVSCLGCDTDAIEASLIRRYISGRSLSTLAFNTGISRREIERTIASAGITLRPIDRPG